MADTTVKTRLIDWGAEVRKEWAEEYNKPEPAYEFSNGETFDDSGDNHGIYTK